jgi:hypothetical protein
VTLLFVPLIPTLLVTAPVPVFSTARILPSKTGNRLRFRPQLFAARHDRAAFALFPPAIYPIAASTILSKKPKRNPKLATLPARPSHIENARPKQVAQPQFKV